MEVGDLPPVEIGEEMLIYYYASPFGQREWYSETSVGVAGCARTALSTIGGRARPVPADRQFVLEGSQLVLNCSGAAEAYQKETTAYAWR